MTRSTRVKTTRARSWNVFERRFRPVTSEDGSLIFHHDQIPRPAANRHWWTVLDCDGHLYLSAGFRFVNRIGYVRCEAPWTDADQLIDYRYD